MIVAENLARSEEDQAGLKTAGKKEKEGELLCAGKV